MTGVSDSADSPIRGVWVGIEPTHPDERSVNPRAQTLLVGACWLTMCVAGSYLATRYEYAPGRLSPGCGSWPTNTRLQRSSQRLTVVAFLHPRCACTAATVKQLVTAIQQQPDAQLVAVTFVPPEPDPGPEWKDGAYVQSLRAGVPSALIVQDPGGLEAQHFRVATSGSILVYDRMGKEVFRGGITDRRGGEENNPALRQFIRTLVEEQAQGPSRTWAVYGCPIDDGTGHRTRPCGALPDQGGSS
jgi:hypothetical protein